MARHIEVWYDETSDAAEPTYCVSMCEADGDEVRCLSTHDDRGEAEDAGRRAARKRGVDVIYRDTCGSWFDLDPLEE